MKSAPNYSQHESAYFQLRKSGADGWGGENFQRRMEGWRSQVEALIQWDQFPTPGSELLEIGSGAGDSLIPFAEAGYRVTGVEISETAVEWAKEKFSNKQIEGRFIQANVAEQFPFENEKFSAVIDAACLHCIIGADRDKVLREIYRVLKPRGIFLVSHMVNDPRELDADRAFNPELRVQEKNGTLYRVMPTLAQLKEEITANGFAVIEENIKQNSWWDHAELRCPKK